MMTEELEALVGHLYVVGQRPVNTSPPGALVELAPKRAPRARERDALFVLVLSAQGTRAGATFFERMAQLAAERYFANSGTVTTGLRDVLMTLNDDLLEHNRKHVAQPFYADIACLVLRRQEITVAKTGGGLVLRWQGDDFQTFPQDLQDPDLINGQPLGYAPGVEIKMARYDAQPGDVIVLADASLNHIPPEKLQAVNVKDGVQQVVAQLKGYHLPEVSATIIRLISPEMPDPVQPIPASRGAPVTSGPATSKPLAQAADRQTRTSPVATPTQAPDRKRFWQQRAQRRKKTGDFKPQPESSAASVPRKRSLTLPSLPSAEKIQTSGKGFLRRAASRILRFVNRLILRLLGLVNGIRRIMDRSIPQPEAGQRPAVPTPIAAGIAVLVPVAVAILVVALSLTTRDETSFEQCLSQFQEAVGGARIADENSLTDAKDYWNRALEFGNRCFDIRPDDPVLLQLRDEAQDRLDSFELVTRCPTTPLRQYPRGAELRGPVLQGGVDLYVLDTVRSVIYRETLNERGNLLIGDSEVIVQRDMALGEYAVRDLVDIAWLTEGGVGPRSALVALDARSGALISYSPTFPPARAQALVGAGRWLRPVAIDTWQGRLYILDPAANQIWRYLPTGGEYPGAPEEYFVGENRPDLSNAVDFAIDEGGNIYILSSYGVIDKYYSAEPLLFQFAQLPPYLGATLMSANAMHLDLGRLRPGFWVLDAQNQIIYELTSAGTFLNSYRAPGDTSFRGLSGLTVDSAAENAYVLAWNTLYQLQTCE